MLPHIGSLFSLPLWFYPSFSLTHPSTSSYPTLPPNLLSNTRLGPHHSSYHSSKWPESSTSSTIASLARRLVVISSSRALATRESEGARASQQSCVVDLPHSHQWFCLHPSRLKSNANIPRFSRYTSFPRTRLSSRKPVAPASAKAPRTIRFVQPTTNTTSVRTKLGGTSLLYARGPS